MSQLMFIVNVLITLSGIYMIVESYKMKQTNKIARQIYLPKDLQTRKCKKEAEYCAYVAPRGIITGTIVLFLGTMAVIGRFVPIMQFFTDWSFVGIIGVYVWLVSYSGRANRTYFDLHR